MKEQLFFCFLLLIPLFNLGAQSIDRDFLYTNITSLNYTRPSGNEGIAGDVAFKDLRLLYSGMITTLDNSDEIFDSQILLRPGFFGIRGKYHSFGFEISLDHPIYKLDQLSLNHGYVGVNNQQTIVSGKKFSFENYFISAKGENLKLFCSKNSAYPGITPAAVYQGCLDYASLTGPSSSGPFFVELKLLTDEFNFITDSLVYNFENRKDYILGKIKETKTSIGDDITFWGEEVAFNVNKNLNDFSFKAYKFDIQKEQALALSGSEIDFNFEPTTIYGKTSSLLLNFNESKMSLSRAEISCQRNQREFDFYNTTFECMSRAKIMPNNSEVFDLSYRNGNFSASAKFAELNLSQAEKRADIFTGKTQYENILLGVDNLRFLCGDSDFLGETTDDLIKGCIKKNRMFPFKVTQKSWIDLSLLGTNNKKASAKIGIRRLEVLSDRFNFDLGQSFVTAGEKRFAYLTPVNGTCGINTDEVISDYSFKSCIKDFAIPQVKIYYQDNLSELMPRYFFNVKSLSSKNQRAQLSIPSLQIADKKSTKTIFDLDVACHQNTDNFKPDLPEMIEDCFVDGSFFTLKIVDTAADLERQRKIDQFVEKFGMTADVDPAEYLRKESGSVESLSVLIKDGIIKLRGRIWVLGFSRAFGLDGKIYLTENKEKIIFDIEKFHIPMTLGNETLAYKYLKSALESERVKVERGRITILLKSSSLFKLKESVK